MHGSIKTPELRPLQVPREPAVSRIYAVGCHFFLQIFMDAGGPHRLEEAPIKRSGVCWCRLNLCVCLESHAPSGLHVRGGLFSVQLLAAAQHPPPTPPGSDAGSLASSALLHCPASHLSLAVGLHGWPASVENQTLMGTLRRWGGAKRSQEGLHAATADGTAPAPLVFQKPNFSTTSATVKMHG